MPPTSRPSSSATATPTTRWGCPAWWSGGPANLPLLSIPRPTSNAVVLPNGMELHIPPPRRADLRREHMEIIEEVGPSTLMDGMILVSGMWPATDFEKGFPIHWPSAMATGARSADHGRSVRDCERPGQRAGRRDQVWSPGIIDIIEQAGPRAWTPYIPWWAASTSRVVFEPTIPATTAALQRINPRYLRPGHCTGWSATHQLARAMPDASHSEQCRDHADVGRADQVDMTLVSRPFPHSPKGPGVGWLPLRCHCDGRSGASRGSRALALFQDRGANRCAESRFRRDFAGFAGDPTQRIRVEGRRAGPLKAKTRVRSSIHASSKG